VAEMEALGLLAEIADHVNQVPYGDRSDVVVEPWLTDQWYVDAKTLAKPALDAVRRGETVFVPRNWEKTYFDWLENIQPWCVSRQLWWGHRIPAWYAEDGEVFVADSEAAAQALAKEHFGKEVVLTQDEDVLDTWFSSALWPFSTLGWPDKTPELNRFYKTDVLVTGFDIIFFWVARMMMMGLHFMNEVPFHTVYIHALVRDEKGAKMSKSKGNVVDPLELMDEFGADALRFTLAAMAAQGRDIKLAKSRIEGYRNFGTKLWNASRFCEMNECALVADYDPSNLKGTVNKWIVGETMQTVRAVGEAIEAYRFNEAAAAAYRFVWNIFCDWFLEFSKPAFNGDDEDLKAETRATAAWVRDQALRLLHPFMPFITEELWARSETRDGMLIGETWPQIDAAPFDASAHEEMEWIINLISEIRSVRSEMNVPAGAKVPLMVKGADTQIRKRLETHEALIKVMARVARITETNTIPEKALQIVVGDVLAILPLADIIDIDQEVTRLEKEMAKAQGEIKKIDGKLSNAQFLSKAPEHVIAEQRSRRAEAVAMAEKLGDAMSRLKGNG